MTDKRIHRSPAILRLQAATAATGERVTLIEIDDEGDIFTICLQLDHEEVLAKLDAVGATSPLHLISAPAFGICPLTGRPFRSGFIGAPDEIAEINAHWEPEPLCASDPEITPGFEPLVFIWHVLTIEPVEAVTDIDIGDASCVTVRCGEGKNGVRMILVDGPAWRIRNEIEAHKTTKRPLMAWLRPRLSGVTHKINGLPLDIGTIRPIEGSKIARS